MSNTKNTAHHVEEDFLEVDRPIPGQNYACLSFISPEKVLARKDEWMFHHYFQEKLELYMKTIGDQVEDILMKSTDNKVDIAQVVKLKKFIDKTLKQDKIKPEEFHESMEDFVSRQGTTLQTQFDETNNFQTSVRGIKVRGVYDTYKEADVRAKVLQRMDTSFNVFVGQVGYWLPWDPDSNNIENQEYMNSDLNRLVKEYKDNEVKKDIFYQEQTRERKKEAMSVSERLKKKLADKKLAEQQATQSTLASAPHSITSSLDDEISQTPVSSSNSVSNEVVENLQAEDPWMQRKRDQQQS